MTTFNLSMELQQSPFYPKDRERDLLPLMEFKDCSMSDEESWEVGDSASYGREEGYVHSNGGSHVLFKGFSLHHSSATLSALYFIFF